MSVINYILNHWEGVVAIIALLFSINANRKRNQTDERNRNFDKAKQIKELKCRRDKASKMLQTLNSSPHNAMEIGNFFTKRTELESEIEYCNEQIKFLES